LKHLKENQYQTILEKSYSSIKVQLLPNHISIIHPHNRLFNVCISNQRQQLQSEANTLMWLQYTYIYSKTYVAYAQCEWQIGDKWRCFWKGRVR